MSWREHIEPDVFYEAPFYLTALIAYGGLLTLNPAIRWGSAERAMDKIVPVEFVAEIPLPPSVSLAPSPREDGTPAQTLHGPGKYEPPKTRNGAVDPPPKLLVKPKPAAVKAKTEKTGATTHKAKSAESKRLRVEHDRAIRASAAAETARKNAAAKALAAQRAVEAKALAAERAAAAKFERDRLAAEARAERERQAAIARDAAERRAQAAREAAELRASAEAERRRLAAEVIAAKARKRAELSRELAVMADLSAARKASAAVALAESANPGDAAGSGGADTLDAKPRGGGSGLEGGGVSWSVDGPVGNRRILQRISPESPDWVATRNLDLTVTVRFQVLADGGVKLGAVIEKTSGFPEIDRLALDALRRWRFQPVAAKPGAAEVLGRVTFRFTS